MTFRSSFALGVLTLALGCSRGATHDHDHDHGSHAEEEEAPTLAITRWTDRYELFVELPAPAPGKPVPYHAHVTRLSDFFAVTEGTFRVRWKTPAGVSAGATQNGVKRPGIFVFESPAPGAGKYTLEMAYEHGGEIDTFDCGTVTVAEPLTAPDEPAGSPITFLKESQWKIPFATAWASERPLAHEIELSATVEPAATDQLTVGAPTGGRFFHNPKLALAEGLRIEKGAVLGTISPTVAGDDFSRVQFAVDDARIAKRQLEREIERVEPLVKDGLLPERRLVTLRNELDSTNARLRSAAGRLGRVVAPGGTAGLSIKSTLGGVVAQVLVPNGEPVEPGAPLVRVGGTEHLWLRARFVARPASTWIDPAPSSARLATGERVALDKLGARLLSSRPVVDPNSRVATWIVDVPRSSAAPAEAEKGGAALLPGASVVVSVRFGKPETVLAVPREAVTEINTRSYLFVQADGEHFEKRGVTLGRTDGEWVQVLSGVKQGERIVTRGGFDIHLASLMGAIESHRH